MIRIVNSDIIEFVRKNSVDNVINPANGLGVMGAGVALALKTAAGKSVEKTSIDYIRNSGARSAGDFFVVPSGDLSRYGVKWILHAVTMRHWNDVLRGASGTIPECCLALDRCLNAIKNHPDIHGNSVVCPALGAGRGRLDKMELGAEMIKVSRKYPNLQIYFVDRDTRMIEAWNSARIRAF